MLLRFLDGKLSTDYIYGNRPDNKPCQGRISAFLNKCPSYNILLFTKNFKCYKI